MFDDGVDQGFARAEVVDDRVGARPEHAAEAPDRDVLDLGLDEVVDDLLEDRGFAGGVGLPGHGISVVGAWSRDRPHTSSRYISCTMGRRV